MNMKKIFLLLAAPILIFSCAAKKEIKEDQTLLYGTCELAGARLSKDLAKAFKEGLPTLTFENAENLSVYGYDGCNRINGKAVLKKNQEISFPPNFISTMMACNKVKSEDFKSGLTQVKSYDLKNNVLILK